MRHRSDANQDAIVQTLRKMGVSVFITTQTGNGFPDLVLGLLGVTYLLEVKNGPNWRLRESQIEFQKKHNAPVLIIETPEQVVEWVNKIRRDNQNAWNRD